MLPLSAVSTLVPPRVQLSRKRPQEEGNNHDGPWNIFLFLVLFQKYIFPTLKCIFMFYLPSAKGKVKKSLFPPPLDEKGGFLYFLAEHLAESQVAQPYMLGSSHTHSVTYTHIHTLADSWKNLAVLMLGQWNLVCRFSEHYFRYCNNRFYLNISLECFLTLLWCFVG